MSAEDAARSAAEALAGLFPEPPGGGIVLGSGLGRLPGLLGASGSIPYADVPGYPRPTVVGHEGAVHRLECDGGAVALFGGRFHRYEGHAGDVVGLPVRTLKALGARRVILTCAAGGVDPTFAAGDLMIVSDHMNPFGWNPVSEIPVEDRDPRFLDLTHCYDSPLTDAMAGAALRSGSSYHRGVLAWAEGPAFETPAEVRMLEHLGADAVCMSTVPEAVLSRYLGLETAAVAVISNRAAGIDDETIRHEAILQVVERSVEGHRDFFADVAVLAARGVTAKPVERAGQGA